MRYFMQFSVMLGDLIVIGIATIPIWFAPRNPLTWIVACLIYRVWNKQGAFMVWKTLRE